MNACCPRLLLMAVLAPAALSFAQAGPASELSPTSLDDHVELTGRSLSERSRQAATSRSAAASSRYTVTQHAAEPLATANQPAGAAAWYGRAPQATQTMLWDCTFNNHTAGADGSIAFKATMYNDATPPAAVDCIIWGFEADSANAFAGDGCVCVDPDAGDCTD